MSFLLGLVLVASGMPGFIAFDQQAHTPIFSKIHTVSIHVKDFQAFNSVFSFLSEELNLPINWGEKWTPDIAADKIYASFWAGNICIEPCGPYTTDEFESDAKTMFFAITFLPYESSKVSAIELERRGLKHNGNMSFLSVTDPSIDTGNCGICIMGLGDETREKDRARESELQTEFALRNGGPLGIIRVDEILVRYTSDADLRRWESLLMTTQKTGENLWKLRDGPAIRLIKDSRTGLAGIVLQVRSVTRATKTLEAEGMLGKVNDDEVQIAEEKAYGLTIVLRE
jgi:hypothetical protein